MNAHIIHIRCRGFMLLEMLVVLGLLAVAAVLSARLFYATSQAVNHANQQQTAQTQFDNALAELRSDVWQAAGVESTGSHTLVIHEADHRTITWDTTRFMERQIGGPHGRVQQWPQVGAVVEFEVRGPRVIVTDRSAQPAGQVVLLAESMLLTGSRP